MSCPRTRLFEVLEAGVDVAYPGAVALVAQDGAVLYHEAHGTLARTPESPVAGCPAERGTVYDLASLTKPLCTTTLCALALSRGRLDLAAPVPADLAPHLRGATFAHLLCHGSGLAAHRPFYRAAADPQEVLRLLAREKPTAPPGTRQVYSDLGFMLLGSWLERLFDRPLDQAFADLVAAPLGLCDPGGAFLGFLPTCGPTDPVLRDRTAPTERYDPPAPGTPEPDYAPLRRRHAPEAWAVVHDDNAFVMGGVAGHAGLFGTAEAVARLASAWLFGTLPGLSSRVRAALWRPCGLSGGTFRHGFDGPSTGGSTGGALAPDAVGHLGFTGTSLWIEPSRRTIYVLLANRVHPDRRRHEAMARVRRAFHQAASALAGPPPPPRNGPG